MGDVSSEPTMEEILSSIKRVIEESESSAPARAPRRPMARSGAASDEAVAPADNDAGEEEVLELSQRAPTPESIEEASPSRGDPIVSASAAEASRGSLETLSRMVVKPETPGSDTLEALVRELLRPMLRNWLDAKLPGIVEAMVAKEIARISGRGF